MINLETQTTAALTRLKPVWNDRSISLNSKIRLMRSLVTFIFLTIVKRRKLQWLGHVSRSSSLAKTILQGTVKWGRRQGRQRKRWEGNIREWTGLEFGKPQRAVENRENGENWFQIICGAPTTLAVKGLVMIMMY